MTAPTLAEIPAMPESFGESAGAEEAQRALTENETRDPDDTDVPDNSAPPRSDALIPAGEKAETAALPATTKSATKSSSPLSETANLSGAAKPEKVSSRTVKRLKRPVLEDRYLELHERAAKLETDNAELNRRAAVVQAVGTDVIEAGVANVVGELVDIADNVTQLCVPKHLASVVALDADERKRLVKLGAPLAKMQLGTYVEKSPALAFLLALGSIGLGKFVAYKLAAHDAQIPLALERSETA